jgi:hypothetical protein
VLVGDTHRFASTHRVSLREGHSYDYIQQRCRAVLQEKTSLHRKYVRKLLLLIQEVEFEWLRQFFIQGDTHRELHAWWHEPIQSLQASLQQCESRLVVVLHTLKAASTSNFSRGQDRSIGSSLGKKVQKLLHEVEPGSYEELAAQLEERASKRAGWESREKDPIYKNCDLALRPIAVHGLPCFQDSAKLAEEFGHVLNESCSSVHYVRYLVEQVKSWQTAFINRVNMIVTK